MRRRGKSAGETAYPTLGRTALVLIFLLLAGNAYAAIDGVVTNATTGKPQPGSTVTLYQTTNQGPQNLGSVKTDAEGKFLFTQDVQAGVGGGPLLLQAVYDGVQYNKTLPPGVPTSGVSIPVYQSTKSPGDAKIEQHFLVLEPSPSGVMQVTEGVIYKNEGKTTWNDPDHGTFQFELPAASEGKVEVNVTAPGGLPIRRAPDPLGKPNQFKIDFAIKPGETEMQLSWGMPFNSPGVFEDHMLSKAGVLRVVAPAGVEFKGDDVMVLGQGPSNSTIYSVKGPDVKLAVQGTGVFNDGPGEQQSSESAGSNTGQSLSENLPKLYGLLTANSTFAQSLGAVKWILLTVLGMLALGFTLLYRKGDPTETTKASTNARGRG
jgi:hypothetical protein